MKPATIESEADLAKLKFPVFVSAKFDGIRCGIYGGKLLTNTLKEIPNHYIKVKLAPLIGNGMFDGELLLKDTMEYNKVQSAVMSREGKPNFYYAIFDRIIDNNNWKMPYKNRLDWLYSYINMPHFLSMTEYVRPVLQIECNSVKEILYVERANVETLGYEGIILRSPDGPYKWGRSTAREGYLFKFKRTDDAEAEILDCVELEHNLNRATEDERGLTKRSSHAENKVGSGMLGSFKVRGINGKYKDKIFFVSCGSMTQQQRRILWEEYHKNKSKSFFKWSIITYTFAKTRGTDDAPAEPRFKAFRKEME